MQARSESAKSVGLQFSCGDTCDIGTILYSPEAIDFAVSLCNPTPEDIVITKVKPSCGCTSGDFKAGTIEAGDSKNITFKIRYAHRPGKTTKLVRFYTENNPDSVKKLYLSADISVGYELVPSRMSLRNAPLNEESRVDFTFTNTSGEPFSVDSIAVYPTGVRLEGVSEKMKIDPGEKITFAACYTPTEDRIVRPKIVLHSNMNKIIKNVNIYGYIMPEQKKPKK